MDYSAFGIFRNGNYGIDGYYGKRRVKGGVNMEITEIFALVTFIVTFICGFIVKKIPQISNKLIPLQNLAIGVIVALIEWAITKDFSTAVMLSGVMAGGVYDIGNNLKKLFENVEK